LRRGSEFIWARLSIWKTPTEHTETQQVDLDQAGELEVVFVPLNDGAVLHRRRLDGHDLRELALGEHETAHVDRAMARQLVEAAHDVDQRLNATIRRIEPTGGETTALQRVGRIRRLAPFRFGCQPVGHIGREPEGPSGIANGGTAAVATRT
jgi:hypothetical protein